MEASKVVATLSALAHQARLAIFRTLVQAGPQGMAAGRIGSALDIPATSLSFHMKELLHAGLVTSRQEGRYVIYAARFDIMNEVLGYLTANCCGGNPCTPVRLPARPRTRART